MSSQDRVACLTVDLEHDFGDLNPSPTFEGLRLLPQLLEFADARNVPLSWFVQGSLFESHPGAVERVATVSPPDVYLHGYSHSDPRTVDQIEEIERGMNEFERFMGKRPTGYRAPLGVISDRELTYLADNGFSFDSSVFPTWRPGRFSHWLAPNRPHFLNGHVMWEIPISVVGRWLPVPVSLSYFKLMGRGFRRAFGTMPLPRTLVVGMHMHDLEPLSSASCLRDAGESALVLERCYGPGAPTGWSVLDGLVTVLNQRGYRFTALSNLALEQSGAAR
jgi:peptidoglycan/xylan/chitin deacetylase (PgdA/CDA1 family)